MSNIKEHKVNFELVERLKGLDIDPDEIPYVIDAVMHTLLLVRKVKMRTLQNHLDRVNRSTIPQSSPRLIMD